MGTFVQAMKNNLSFESKETARPISIRIRWISDIQRDSLPDDEASLAKFNWDDSHTIFKCDFRANAIILQTKAPSYATHLTMSPNHCHMMKMGRITVPIDATKILCVTQVIVDEACKMDAADTTDMWVHDADIFKKPGGDKWNWIVNGHPTKSNYTKNMINTAFIQQRMAFNVYSYMTRKIFEKKGFSVKNNVNTEQKVDDEEIMQNEGDNE